MRKGGGVVAQSYPNHPVAAGAAVAQSCLTRLEQGEPDFPPVQEELEGEVRPEPRQWGRKGHPHQAI